jgi:carbon-monoxide dehydrogenase medium subunit
MPNQWTWFRPASLDEAVGLMLEHGDAAVPIAGGTALCLKPPRWERPVMIDLQAVGLGAIDPSAGDTVAIGAMATARTLVASEVLGDVGSGMLRDAGTTMGPQPVRNRVTVGGNVMQVFRWCNLPVALLALGARFTIAGASGSRREIGADAFFEKQPSRSLQPGELLESVSVARDAAGEGGAFARLALTAVDHSMATAAVRVRLEGERCAAARVVVGALAMLPERLPGVESQLVGKAPTPAALADAAAAAASCTVQTQRRADEEYSREMAVVLVRRALETAFERARAAGPGGAR